MTLSRGKFLSTAMSASASGLIVTATGASATAAAANLLVLENDRFLVAINRETGCVDRLESKDQAWKMQGAGMRLHVPAPEHRFHYLTERNSGNPRIESDGVQATMTWSGFEATGWANLTSR